MPVSVKQLDGATQASPSDPYALAGHELVNVRLVGRIVAIEDDASTCKVMIHDGTGTAQFTIYTDNGLWPATRETYACVTRRGGSRRGESVFTPQKGCSAMTHPVTPPPPTPPSYPPLPL